MSIDHKKKRAIISLTPQGAISGLKLINYFNEGDLYLSKKLEKDISEINQNIIFFDDKFSKQVEMIFDSYKELIFIMATGIVVRTIAPLIKDKFKDPAIIVMDEKMEFAISLLSGHMGGANELAKSLEQIGAQAVITTATDVNEVGSLDMIAKKIDAHIDDFREVVLKINYMLVNKENVAIIFDEPYKELGLQESDLKGFKIEKDIDSISNRYSALIHVTSSREELDLENYYKVIPRNLILGMGCRRGIEIEHLKESLLKFSIEEDFDLRAIKKLVSIDVKKDEKAFLELAEALKVEFKTFSVEELLRVEHLFEGSAFVKKSVGVSAVAEPSAYLASNGNLIVKKKRFEKITFSLGKVRNI